MFNKCIPLVAAVGLLVGCSEVVKTQPKTTAKTDPAKTAAKTDHDHDHHHHEHKAPHGGTLVALGDHLAHLEVVLDAAGKMTVYVLDGEAEKPVKVKHETIDIKVTPGKGEPFTVKLKAVASSLTGEKVGDTSQFEAQDDKLKALKEFDALVDQKLDVKGQELKPVRFNFPKGNEHEGHDHDHK